MTGSIYENLVSLLLTSSPAFEKQCKFSTFQNKNINSQSFEPLTANLKQHSFPLCRLQSLLEISMPSFFVTTGVSSQFVATGSIGRLFPFRP